MPPLSILLKPSSGNCNLRCQYCFYYDTMQNREISSYGMMTEETLEQVIKKALYYAEGECSFAWQGGEPTLRGLSFFQKAIELQEKYKKNGVQIYNALQTNGYELDRKWADFFAKNHFLIGLSMDGLPKTHDKYRKTPKGEKTFSKIMETANLLKRRKVDFNILTVVNRETAGQAEQIYRFYKKNGFFYLQFIACLDPIGEVTGTREYSLTARDYGTFLIELFRLWKEDFENGCQPYIRMFENYIGILLGYPPESCEQRGVCGMQYVIEADGTVYPCDFYVLDDYKLGNLNEREFPEIDKKRKEIRFIEASLEHREDCKECAYLPLCRGGCRRHFVKEEGVRKNIFCQAYKMFFDTYDTELVRLAKEVQIRRKL